MNGRSILGRGSFCAVVALTLVFACGGEDERPHSLNPPPGGAAGRAGAGAMGGVGGVGGASGAVGTGGTAGAPQPGAPVVTIVSPADLTDPNAAGVIVDTLEKPNPVKVVCTVTQSTDSGSKGVDPASVTIELLDADGKAVGKALKGMRTTGDDYSAEFPLTSVPTGPFSVRCSAADVSSPPKPNQDTNRTFVDHGPQITIVRPKKDTAEALRGDVAFEFTVAPAPVADGDQGAAVTAATLEVAGVEIKDLTETQPGTYFASIDFKNQTRFPNGAGATTPVVVRAKNARTPEPATASSPYTFKVDGTGPAIKVTKPDDQAVVGGEVTITFTINDAQTSVNDDTVIVKVNGVDHRYSRSDPAWTVVNGTYTFRFDTRSGDANRSVVQLTINILADDIVGNASPGASVTLYLDNVAPIVDLDPGNVRELRTTPNPDECSESFDPLGTAVNDLAEVQRYPLIRSLVFERTNGSGEGTVAYYAGVKAGSVILYLRTDPALPLLKDTDGNGTCDELEIADATKRIFRVLEPIAPTGSSWFNSESTDFPPMVGCVAKNDTQAPQKLCTAQIGDLRRVIRQGLAGPTPAIYAGGPTAAECIGSPWEIAALASEGWVCLAARAEDNVGNVGISAPLRLCLGSSPCPQPPPSCRLNNCTLPPEFAGGIIRE